MQNSANNETKISSIFIDISLYNLCFLLCFFLVGRPIDHLVAELALPASQKYKLQ